MSTSPLYDTVGHVNFQGKIKIIYRYFHDDKPQEVISRTPLTEDEVGEYIGKYKFDEKDAALLKLAEAYIDNHFDQVAKASE